MDFRGLLPLTPELIALPLAIKDIAKFTNYDQVMGSKAPSLAQVTAAFAITNGWSETRTRADAWDQYARAQEGLSWTQLRRLISRMRPAFVLAVQADPALGVGLPVLSALLEAKKGIAQKGVSTKKANKKAVAEGKAPTHGKVGKASQKKAAKAALVKVQGEESSGGGNGAAAPVVTTPVVAEAPGGGTGGTPAAQVVPAAQAAQAVQGTGVAIGNGAGASGAAANGAGGGAGH
jgi:hypothetical protein